jgi:predicted DNA-binding protein YlxM (UPF0122 family)
MKKNIKSLTIRLRCQLTLADIAKLMGISRQALHHHIKDENTCKLSNALKLEEITGIKHQFFLYPMPIAAQFLSEENQ